VRPQEPSLLRQQEPSDAGPQRHPLLRLRGEAVFTQARRRLRVVPSGSSLLTRSWKVAVVVLAASAAVAPTGAGAATPFLWGVATSSYQVEGGITNDDYDFFNADPTIRAFVASWSGQAGPPIQTRPAGEATRSWQPQHYRRDFDNARVLGLNSFRISIEWSRIEPSRGVWNDGPSGLGGYVAMIDTMRARHLRPVVTLNHFGLPLWALHPPTGHLNALPPRAIPDASYLASMRGWESTDTVAEYVQFARHVVARLAGRVDNWITINEPVGSMVAIGYIGGVWSPGFVADGDRAKTVLHNLIDAHVLAYNAIHRADAKDADGDRVAATVGVAHSMLVTTPAPSSNPEAALNVDYFLNDYFLNAVINGEEDLYYLNRFPCCVRHDTTSPFFVVHPEWRNKVDFIGLNYYRRALIFYDVGIDVTGTGFLGGRFDNNLYGHFEIPHALLNDLGWETYPAGLYDLLVRIRDRWHKPVLITENGMPESADKNRSAYIVAHVREIARAIHDGVDVRGYLYWTLNDNWELGENYRPQSRFGLFRVERNPSDWTKCLGSCHRTITEAALALKELVAEARANDLRGRPTAPAVDAAKRRFGAISRDGRALLPPERTYARAWSAQTSTGRRFELLLMRTDARAKWLPLLYWKDIKAWHAAVVASSRGRVRMTESWFDSLGRQQTRVHTLSRLPSGSVFGSFANGRQKTSWTATPIVGVGLWRWAGESPWGGPNEGKLFEIANLENAYVGKFLTYATSSRGAAWRDLTDVAVRPGTPRSIEIVDRPVFHLTLALATPAAATTLAVHRGTWVAVKGSYPAPLPLGFSGHTIAPFEILWQGTRDDGAGIAFGEGERRPALLNYPPNADAQSRKESDESSVVFRTFAFTPAPFGGSIRVFAGGRQYDCTLQFSTCTGTWQDVAGLATVRVPDGMPTFP
jgi:beta-glucosidase/6-phospho-beta-glucosidase/beta-galactosidase